MTVYTSDVHHTFVIWINSDVHHTFVTRVHVNVVIPLAYHLNNKNNNNNNNCNKPSLLPRLFAFACLLNQLQSCRFEPGRGWGQSI